MRGGKRIGGIMSLRVVVVREGDWWVAQGLEWDLAAQGHTVGEALESLKAVVMTQFCLCLEHGLDPRKEAIPAPEQYRIAFDIGIPLKPKPSEHHEQLPEAWMIDALKKAQYRICA